MSTYEWVNVWWATSPTPRHVEMTVAGEIDAVLAEAGIAQWDTERYGGFVPWLQRQFPNRYDIYVFDPATREWDWIARGHSYDSAYKLAHAEAIEYGLGRVTSDSLDLIVQADGSTQEGEGW